MSVTARSVVIDIANNYGNAYVVGIRQIDFYLGTSKVAITGTTALATTTLSGSTNYSWFSFNTTLSKVGTPNYTQWYSAVNSVTNQRLILNTASDLTFDRIVINNSHEAGTGTDAGAQNVKITIAPATISNTTYNATVLNGTVLFDGTLDQHPAYNAGNDQTVYGTASTVGYQSVIFDIADNWGATDYIGIRSVEFYKNSTLISLTSSDASAFATSDNGTSFEPYHAFITSESKTGSIASTEWYSGSAITNQRLICNFLNGPVDFDEIVVNNSHHVGTNTARGVRHVVIKACPNQWATTTYNGTILGSTNLTSTIEFPQHVASDVADPQVVYEYVLEDIDISVDFVTVCEISGITANAELPPTADVDCDISAARPALTGVTVNSAPVPFVFLVQSEAPDGDTDFFDVANNLPVHATGDVRHVTDPTDTNPYFGNSCIMLTSSFHGTADGVLYTDESDYFAFGTGDFTVDYWLYQIYPGTNGQIFGFSGSPTGLNKPAIVLERVSLYNYFWLTFSGMSSGSVGYHDMNASKWWADRVWHHLAYDRREGIGRISRGGVVLYEVADTTNYDARILTIGNNNCYIEELRVSRYSRWGGAFTPDTAPFVAEEETTAGSFTPLMPSISAAVFNTPPDKTYNNGQPWINQYTFNTTSPTNIGTFSQGTNFPTGISHGSALVVDEFVFIVGGTTNFTSGSPNNPPPDADETAVYYAVKNSDGTIGTWTETTSLPDQRYGAQLFQTYNRIFLVGGYAYGQPVNYVWTAPINADGTLGEWASTYPMVSTRADFALSVTRNRVYALGGYADAEIGGFVSDTYEYATINYDGTIGEWQIGGSLAHARDNCFSVCTGSKLYIIGGGTLTVPLNTDSISVSAEGVLVGDWTTESWYEYPGKAFVCSSSRLFVLGGKAGNDSLDEVYSRDITSGTISATQDFRCYLPKEVYAPIAFLTKSRIYVIGGVSTDDPVYSDEWETTNVTGSATFSGMDVDFSLYTSVEEETAIPIGGNVASPKVALLSYFGYGSLCFGDVVSPVPVVDGITRYTETIIGDVIAPLPVMESIGHFWRYIDTEIVAPLSQVSGGVGEIINGSISAPASAVSSYVARSYFMTDYRTKLPVISASVSCPYVINASVKAVHPHLNSTFQSITNIHAPVPVISSITINPGAAWASNVAKAPSISSLVSNPELINSSIAAKPPMIGSTVLETAYISTAIKSKVPIIHSYTDEGAIRITGNFVPLHPEIHGAFVMSDDYSLIKYRENRLCRR